MNATNAMSQPRRHGRPLVHPVQTNGPVPAGTQRLDATELASHRKFLHGYAIGQTRDHDLAEDLVQETMIAAMTSGERFAGHSSVRTWLVSILRHKILDAYRQQARDPISLDALQAGDEDEGSTHSADEMLSTELGTSTDSHVRGPEAVIAEKALWTRFEHHLDHLPSRTARAFVLSEILGHETVEVSEMLATTPENVWGMVHRARKSLQSAMATERNLI